MYWRATMSDGTIKQHIQHDVHGPACAHEELDPADVKRFECIEGNEPVWGMDGMPMNVRKRTAVSAGRKAMEMYIIVLMHSVVFVFADGRVVELPEFLPDKFPGAATIGKAKITDKGDVTIDGKEFPKGYALFTPIVEHPELPHHHKDHKHSHICPRKP